MTPASLFGSSSVATLRAVSLGKVSWLESGNIRETRGKWRTEIPSLGAAVATCQVKCEVGLEGISLPWDVTGRTRGGQPAHLSQHNSLVEAHQSVSPWQPDKTTTRLCTSRDARIIVSSNLLLWIGNCKLTYFCYFCCCQVRCRQTGSGT